jgi:Domain of unknown function (DUF4326)
MPIAVQRKRTKGWRSPPHTKSVCRPGDWGNPYAVTPDRSAAQAVLQYEEGLLARKIKDKRGTPMIDRIAELRGWNLMCFCAIGESCHRDVLLRLAN